MSATADFTIRHRGLQRYILANEKIIIATHRHWAILWEPILTTVGSFVLALTVLISVSPYRRDDLEWLWIPFFILTGRLLYKWLTLRAEWFLVTDRRLLLLTGLLIHRVAMMPTDKVTDLGYERTPIGQLFGFGTFTFETAGQDQALERATWIPQPDARYRLISAALFHPDAADAEVAAQSGSENPSLEKSAEQDSSNTTVPPPALMPRIGRRSNPPTQLIEVSSTMDDDSEDDAAPDNSGAEKDSDVRKHQPQTGNKPDGGYVPGGPTTQPNTDVERPSPFLEDGMYPKIR